MSTGAVSLPLVTVSVLATSVWTGGLVAIFVVARVASKTLETPQRINFFRTLGRRYGVVGTLALLVGLASGATLLRSHPWTPIQLAAAIVAGALLAATGAGMMQARAMTRLRRRALTEASPSSSQLRRGAQLAAALRGAIGLLTLALIILGAALARS